MLLFFYNNQLYLLLLTILFYITSLCVIKYNKQYLSKPDYTKSQIFTTKFLRYLDTYYITNKFYSFVIVILYIFCQIGWVFIYRLIVIFYQEQHSNIKIEYTDFTYNTNIISFIILLLSTVITFKILINTLLFKELLKMHLFLLKYKSYNIMQTYLIKYYLVDFWGKLYLFFYNVYNQRKDYTNEGPDYYIFFSYHGIYNYTIVRNSSDLLMQWCKNSKWLYFFIGSLSSLLRWLYYNMRLDGFANYILYILLFLISFIIFLEGPKKYLYILFFLIYVFIQIINYVKFHSNRCYVTEGVISNYFYTNTTLYHKQRLLLYKDFYKFNDDMYKSDESKTLLNHMKDDNIRTSLIHYVLRDFIDFSSKDPEHNNYMRKFRVMHFRYYILILIYIGLLYIILFQYKYTFYYYDNIISLKGLIILFTLIITYFACNIYKSKKNNLDHCFNEYHYSKNYAIIFWILVLIIIGAFGVLILKANIFYITDSILWNYGKIKITYDYTIEEKLEYFWTVFEMMSKPYCIIESFEYYKAMMSNINITKDTDFYEIKELIRTSTTAIIYMELTHFEIIKSVLIKDYSYYLRVEHQSEPYFQIFKFITILTASYKIGAIIQLCHKYYYFSSNVVLFISKALHIVFDSMQKNARNDQTKTGYTVNVFLRLFKYAKYMKEYYKKPRV